VFNNVALEPIRDVLNEFWHSNHKSNKYFWKHEWLKHGTCTNPLLSELKFFNKAIELYKLIDMMYQNDNTILQKYYNKNSNTYLIPFDLKFNLIHEI